MMKRPSPSEVKSPLVEVKGLTIERGDRQIIHKINWKIMPGEHWVILGPNGSGKTSLLAALTGYLFPSSGEISVLGETFGESDWRDLRRHIGIVSSTIHNRLEESEIVINAVISGKDAIINSCRSATPRERILALRTLDLVECRHLSTHAWGILSQGERQRVLIGRALMARPKILILDEACAGLDPVAREHFLQFLLRMTKMRGAPTLIFVTHHLEEITPAFSHILMLRAGEILASGKLCSCLTSRLLSRMFDTPVRIRKQSGNFSISISSKVGTVV